jgi:ParB family chromosome partitioning protein
MQEDAVGATSPEEGGTVEAEDPDDLVRPLPDKLVTDLTAHRTLALRDALAASPLVAFAAMLHAIVLECFYTYASSASCVGIALRNHSMVGYDAALNDTPSARAIRERHEGWSERLPDATADLWDVLAGLDADDQAALFAHCVSFGVNAVWEPATRYNEGRACGAEAAARIAGLKKPEMASAAEDLLKGTGWLAHPLRTPVIDEPDGDGELAAANDDGPAIEAGHDELGDDDIDAIAAE